MQKNFRILIMAGGTGGHVFPALAIAEALRKDGVEVHWLGTEQGLESSIVPKANIPLHYLTISAVRGKGLLRKLLTPWNVLLAVIQADKIIRQLKPDVILGMGGYASGPGAIAAWLMRIPLVIHEQNTAPGLTNRMLGKIAKRVLQAFPHSFVPSYQAKTVGNPVRNEIVQLPAPLLRFEQRNGPIQLLILGGSQGAASLNKHIPAALAAIAKEQALQIWHQTGAKHLAITQQKYAELGLTANVEPFVENMAQAYGWADLIICRAGALTVSELAAAGVGSILIPFPYAVDDHQTHNARFLAAVGAAEILADKRLVSGELRAILDRLLQDRTHLLTMAQAARYLSPANAVADIVGEINSVVRTKK